MQNRNISAFNNKLRQDCLSLIESPWQISAQPWLLLVELTLLKRSKESSAASFEATCSRETGLPLKSSKNLRIKRLSALAGAVRRGLSLPSEEHGYSPAASMIVEQGSSSAAAAVAEHASASNAAAAAAEQAGGSNAEPIASEQAGDGAAAGAPKAKRRSGRRAREKAALREAAVIGDAAEVPLAPNADLAGAAAAAALAQTSLPAPAANLFEPFAGAHLADFAPSGAASSAAGPAAVPAGGGAAAASGLEATTGGGRSRVPSGDTVATRGDTVAVHGVGRRTHDSLSSVAAGVDQIALALAGIGFRSTISIQSQPMGVPAPREATPAVARGRGLASPNVSAQPSAAMLPQGSVEAPADAAPATQPPSSHEIEETFTCPISQVSF